MDNTKPTDIKSMLKSRFCIVTNLTKTASYWLKSLSILNSVANTISHRQTIGSSITNTKGIVFWYERVSWNGCIFQNYSLPHKRTAVNPIQHSSAV